MLKFEKKIRRQKVKCHLEYHLELHESIYKVQEGNMFIIIFFHYFFMLEQFQKRHDTRSHSTIHLDTLRLLKKKKGSPYNRLLRPLGWVEV